MRAASRAAGRRPCPLPRPSASRRPTIARPPSGAGRPAELAGVHEHLVLRVGGVGRVGRRLLAGGRDHRPDLEPVRLGEFEVALVVGRHGHDRAGAVFGQDVVGHPHRDLLAVHGVGDVAAGEDAGLLLRLGPLDRRARAGVADVVGHGPLVLAAPGELDRARVLRREHEERGAVERVRAGREHLERRAVAERERHLGALGAADPVALHRHHPLGPAHVREVVQQPVGIRRDPEEPLLERARLDLGPAALAVAVDHLLVREHRLVVRAPVHVRALAEREPGVEEAQEDPLRPAVVLGLGGRELALPVDRPAHAPHLAADRGDVLAGGLGRVPARPDRGVLRRKPERVVAHRVHDPVTEAAPVQGDHVAHRVVLDVAHVQLAGRVREHLEHVRQVVGGLAGGGVGHVEDALALPDLLPSSLDGGRIVPVHVRHSTGRPAPAPPSHAGLDHHVEHHGEQQHELDPGDEEDAPDPLLHLR